MSPYIMRRFFHKDLSTQKSFLDFNQEPIDVYFVFKIPFIGIDLYFY